MKDYTAGELLEMANWNPGPDVELSVAGNITGVCIPQNFEAGQIIDPNRARKLAAQLLHNAELHDRIWEAGYEKGLAVSEQQCATMRSALQKVRDIVNWRRDGREQPSVKEFHMAINLLEALTSNPKEN